MMTRIGLKAAAASILCLAIAAPAVWSQTAASKPDEPGQTAPASSAAAADPASTTAPPAAPAEAVAATGPDQQWEVTTSTTVGADTPKTTTASLCVAADDLKKPPVALTGPQCSDQAFKTEGSTVSWKGTCATAKGWGKLTFGADQKTLAGDVTAMVGATKTTMHIDAKVTGSCTKS